MNETGKLPHSNSGKVLVWRCAWCVPWHRQCVKLLVKQFDFTHGVCETCKVKFMRQAAAMNATKGQTKV